MPDKVKMILLPNYTPFLWLDNDKNEWLVFNPDIFKRPFAITVSSPGHTCLFRSRPDVASYLYAKFGIALYFHDN